MPDVASTELYDKAVEFFAVAEQAPEGQKFLRATDVNSPDFVGYQDYQFEVTDGDSFYVTFQGDVAKGGKLTVHPGHTARTDILERVVAEMDTATVLDLFEARISPLEARKLERWRDVGGESHLKRPFLALLTVLVRVGQDEVRRRVLRPRV